MFIVENFGTWAEHATQPHSSHRVTHGPIPGGYENRANAAELSDRGGGDAIGLGPEFLLEMSFRNIRLGDTLEPEHSESVGKWIFWLGVAR